MGSQIESLLINSHLLLQYFSSDGMMEITFFPIIFVITTTPWYANMLFVICAIVVYRIAWISDSNIRLFKCHVRGQIVKLHSIVNRHCVDGYDHIGC